MSRPDDDSSSGSKLVVAQIKLFKSELVVILNIYRCRKNLLFYSLAFNSFSYCYFKEFKFLNIFNFIT